MSWATDLPVLIGLNLGPQITLGCFGGIARTQRFDGDVPAKLWLQGGAHLAWNPGRVAPMFDVVVLQPLSDRDGARAVNLAFSLQLEAPSRAADYKKIGREPP